MFSSHTSWTPAAGFSPSLAELAAIHPQPQLVLIFGYRQLLRDSFPLSELQTAFPSAILSGCSSGGEIVGTAVGFQSVQITLVSFDRTGLRFGQVHFGERTGSRQAGLELAASIPHEQLIHAFILSDGVEVNGSDLVEGLRTGFPASVSISGGLAADMDDFKQTVVLAQNAFSSRTATVVGFYGSSLRIGCGSGGGWDPFGPIRLITRSDQNVLYEVDGKSVLELYRTYLGEAAAGLPATGLLFPLSLMAEPRGSPLVRTVLACDEAQQSMTFAGNLPQGAYTRMMKANTDRLIEGANRAAQINRQCLADHSPQLAILISCVGRRMVMRQRVEEELEAVQETLGEQCRLSGFYSYGEISPHELGKSSEFHNQTMTITTFAEDGP